MALGCIAASAPARTGRAGRKFADVAAFDSVCATGAPVCSGAGTVARDVGFVGLVGGNYNVLAAAGTAAAAATVALFYCTFGHFCGAIVSAHLL